MSISDDANMNWINFLWVKLLLAIEEMLFIEYSYLERIKIKTIYGILFKGQYFANENGFPLNSYKHISNNMPPEQISYLSGKINLNLWWEISIWPQGDI